jgi:hypothetical protein
MSFSQVFRRKAFKTQRWPQGGLFLSTPVIFSATVMARVDRQAKTE